MIATPMRSCRAPGRDLHDGYCGECTDYHPPPPPSPFEVEVLALIARGLTHGEITRELGHNRGRWAVNNLTKKLLRRYRAANVANLVAIVVSLGIIDPQPFLESHNA